MAAANPTPYNGDPTNLTPATHAFAVSPDDNNDLSVVTRYVYVGVAGDLKLTTMDGDTITLVGLAAGVLHPVRAKRIWSSVTAAQSIVGLY